MKHKMLHSPIYSLTLVYVFPLRSGQVKEIGDGIRAYFNAMLGSQLLYKFERLQYAEVCIHVYHQGLRHS